MDNRPLICHLHAVVGQVLRLSPQPSNNKSTSLAAAIVSFSLMNAKVASRIGRNTNKNVESLQIQSVLLCQINLLGEKGALHSAKLGQIREVTESRPLQLWAHVFLRDFSGLWLKATSKSSLSLPLGKLFHRLS